VKIVATARRRSGVLLVGLTFLLGGSALADAVVFDFDAGPGPLFEVQNSGSLWTVDPDGPTLRISKPADPLGVNPQGFIAGGIRSAFCLEGDFTMTVDFELFDFPRDPANPSTLNESILAVEDQVFHVFEILRFVSGSSATQKIEAFGPDAPIGQQNAPPSVLWTGRYRITRVGATMSGAFAALGSETFTALGSATGYGGPVVVSCLGVQGVGHVDRNRAGTALDIAFDSLIVDGVIGCLPDGACCQADGACAISTEIDCPPPGIWHSEWTSCAPDPCVQVGACCQPDGTCSAMTQDDCPAPGIWQGAGTACNPNLCLLGACCMYVTCEIHDVAACAARGGTYQGNGTLCQPNPCPTSGVHSEHPRVTRLQVLTAPNPSTAGVVIRCLLPQREAATVVLFDASGRVVRRLHDGDLPAGETPLPWNGRDDAGRAVPAGVYLVKVTTPAEEASGRLVVTS
jgi:hypothetical protein